jgi:hypothetical protein
MVQTTTRKTNTTDEDSSIEKEKNNIHIRLRSTCLRYEQGVGKEKNTNTSQAPLPVKPAERKQKTQLQMANIHLYTPESSRRHRLWWRFSDLVTDTFGGRLALVADIDIRCRVTADAFDVSGEFGARHYAFQRNRLVLAIRLLGRFAVGDDLAAERPLQVVIQMAMASSRTMRIVCCTAQGSIAFPAFAPGIHALFVLVSNPVQDQDRKQHCKELRQ